MTVRVGRRFKVRPLTYLLMVIVILFGYHTNALGALYANLGNLGWLQFRFSDDESKLHKATEYLKRAVDHSPPSWRVQLHLGACYIMQGDTVPAIRVWRQNKGRIAEYLMRSGSSILDLREAEVYHLVIDLDPGLAAPYLALAHLHEKEGEIDKALDALHAFLEANPGVETSSSYFVRGEIARLQQDWVSAAAAYQQATELDSSNVNYHYYAGLMFLRAGDRKAAVRHWRRGLEVDPNNVRTLMRLGESLNAQGHHAEAAALFEQADQLMNGKLWSAALYLGQYRFSQGDYEGAIDYLERASEMKPNHPKIEKWLDKSYQALEQKR